MSKSRKIYIGILILAAGALIIDKTVLHPSASQPEQAQAQAANSPSTDTPEVSNDSINSQPGFTTEFAVSLAPEKTPEDFTAAEPLPKVTNIINRMLNVLTGDESSPSQSGDSRDLFSASDEFLSAIRLKSVRPPEPNILPQPLPVPPVYSLKLTGIVIGPSRYLAFINNEVFLPGQHIGPYQLVRVNPDSVVLEVQNEQITIFLDK